MALTLLQLMPNAAQYDIRILATDIDPNMINEAKAGIYPVDLVNDIPADLRRRWIQENPEDASTVQMAPAVRDLIEFRTLNLVKTWPLRARSRRSSAAT